MNNPRTRTARAGCFSDNKKKPRRGPAHSERGHLPFSESQFKTLKYCPAFPERFGGIHDARAFGEKFFTYYNHEHRHPVIGYHTPASVHYGTATEVRAQRGHARRCLCCQPNRFRRRCPEAPKLPTVAWINQPTDDRAQNH